MIALLVVGMASAKPTQPGTGVGAADEAVADADDLTVNSMDRPPDPYRDGSIFWKQVGGALFPTQPGDDPTQLVEASPTSYNDNLYTTKFATAKLGLAAGSTCTDSTPEAERGCRPVAYLFSDTPEKGGEAWEKLDVPGDQRPGYIGAIAWMNPTTAMLVGGSGIYPRREPAAGLDANGNPCPAPPPGKPYVWECDPAGKARAWLYDDGAVCELGRDAGCPELPKARGAETPHGLTAIDFRFDPDRDEILGFAGGLGQMWRWQGWPDKGGGFNRIYDNDSPKDHLDQDTGSEINPDSFNYRVREIRFFPLPTPRAFAVTTGCCSTTGQGPTILVYSETCCAGGSWRPPLWYLLQHPPSAPGANNSFVGTTTGIPENKYAADFSAAGWVLSSAAGPRTPNEPRSHLECTGGDNNSFSTDTNQGPNRARFLAIDGVVGTGYQACPGPPDWGVGELPELSAPGHGWRGFAFAKRTPERTPPSTDLPGPDPKCGAQPLQGLPSCSAVTTLNGTAARLSDKNWEPFPSCKGIWCGNLEFVTSSYTLSALDLVGESGAGWTVGDHGAILRLQMPKQAQGEPNSPKLGNREPGELDDRSPYPSPKPAGTAGMLPNLSSQPRQQLDEPRVEIAGSPDATFQTQSLQKTEDVGKIVMSRDGSEGWAIGPNAGNDYWGAGTDPVPNGYGVASLYHWDGNAWTRCDPVGLRAQLAADPACSAVAGLRSYSDQQGIERTVQLWSAARVPYENDDNPSNDDRFEVVAIGTKYRDPDTQPAPDDPVILRYSGGRWDFEPLEVRRAVTSVVGVAPWGGTNLTAQGRLVLKDIAFTAPDDGWILGRHGGQGQSTGRISNELYRYNGESWERCRLAETIDPNSGRGELYPTDAELADCGAERIAGWEGQSGINKDQMRLIGAGDRVYVYGTRLVDGLGIQVTTPFNLGDQARSEAGRVPFILFHERGATSWTDGSGPNENGGGYDPGFENQNPGVSGFIESLAVAENSDGTHSGWAIGQFYDSQLPGHGSVREPAAVAMRLVSDGEHESWRPVRDPVLDDYLWPSTSRDLAVRASEPELQAMLPQPHGEAIGLLAQNNKGRAFAFNPSSNRWSVINAQRPPSDFEHVGGSHGFEALHGEHQAVAPDNQGGAWMAVKNTRSGGASNPGWSSGGKVFFYHYGSRPPKPVLADVAQPFGERHLRLTGLAGAADGSIWLATDSDWVARYDRVIGWQTARIPGWTVGRTATVAPAINAIATAPDGSAVAVGEEGRVAALTPTGVRIDETTGILCEGAAAGRGCGTSRDLMAAAVAPDGSALAGGRAMATVWRPAGSPFERINDPPGDTNTTITGISMPTSNQAWIVTDKGFVSRGELLPSGGWTWEVENRIQSGPDRGLTLGAINLERNLPLRAVAIASDGHGYAVGDKGLVLERTSDPEQPWRRLRGPGTDDLTSVTLAVGNSQRAIIGGRHGVVWTVSGSDVFIARSGDIFRESPGFTEDAANFGPLTGPVVGAALLPGIEDGQTEAWVAIQRRGANTDRLLHYASDPEEPLLNPEERAKSLPDAPPPRPGEIRFAALGKSDCQQRVFCTPMIGSTDTAEVTLARIVEELRESSDRPPVDFALFTGDAANGTGAVATSVSSLDRRSDLVSSLCAVDFCTVSLAPRSFGARHHRRFSELVADPLADSGIPMLGAVGPGDLSRPYSGALTLEAGERTKTGENLAWREGFINRPAPWGLGSDYASATGLELGPAAGADATAQPFPDISVDADLDADRQLVTEPVEVKGWARTHYAVDVSRNGDPAARIVVLDSSLRGLSAADAIQNPIESGGGQLEWVERMLCFEGQPSPSISGECTRERDQQAIILTNTPTYTYSPRLDPTALASDGSVLEATYLRYRVSVVVSGRLGWNGLYYALAPGLHTPCPNGAYPEHPPRQGAPICSSVGDRLPDPTGRTRAVNLDAATKIAEKAAGYVPRTTETTGGLGDDAGLVPFVVSSGAGGKFGPQGEVPEGSAADGFWHGYTIVRLSSDGDPRKLVVEQRPIFDWISIQGNEHVIPARQKLRLEGIGRGPIAYSQASNTSTASYVEISTAAVTHRFDLLLSDPMAPWIPCRADKPHCSTLHARLARGGSLETSGAAGSSRYEDGGCKPYLCLPERIATIDSYSGTVTAGNGKYPDTFAIAMLSVDEKVATYPLMFKKSPSFVIQPFAFAPSAPGPAPVTPNSPQAPPPPNPPQPNVPNVSVPDVPPPPPVPPIAASEPPEPQPPAPPAPPPPTEQPTALSLTLAPPGVALATPTAVIQPPTPPVNPAPPSGARREARQRQAAAQKSGADSDESQQGLSDAADGPPEPKGTAFARRDRMRPEPSFTALAHAVQPSAWAQGALYTGGATLVAFALAAGWSRGRPTPRQRPPEVPAPAHAQIRSRRR